MKISDRVREAESMPRGYGVAWYEPACRWAVVYPVPFNILLRFLRKLWFRLAFPTKNMRELREQAIYHRGYQEGIEWTRKESETLPAGRIREAYAAGWKHSCDWMLAELDKESEKRETLTNEDTLG